MAKDGRSMCMISYFMPQKLLDDIKSYHIDSQIKPLLPHENQSIIDPPPGYVGVYTNFFRSGLHLPTFDFLNSVLSHYKLHIAQIAPNGFKKIMCFMLLNKALNIVPSLSVFRHFFVTMVTNDLVEDAHVREYDYALELTHQERSAIDRLVANFIKWAKFDVSTLELAGLGDATYVNDSLPTPVLHGQGCSMTIRSMSIPIWNPSRASSFSFKTSNHSSVSSPKNPDTVRHSKLATPSNTDGDSDGVTLGDSTENVDCSTLEATIESSRLHECPVYSDPKLTATIEATTESIILITLIFVVKPIQQVLLTTPNPTTNVFLSIDSQVRVLVSPTSEILPMMSLLKNGVSKQDFREKLFGICPPIPTTTIMTPLVVFEPVSRAPVVSIANTMVVEALISSADNTALDTPS
ncbi:unnamed protein product [Lactuca saligna]|uniref:Transposase (putative) gypsy type domain-containing protein n=1 Tax=Lactuca saligna TaxID=75948 RepID=A0AA36A0I0_LACSI|nr:unnamed protein product [Lactuca saligna]